MMSNHELRRRQWWHKKNKGRCSWCGKSDEPGHLRKEHFGVWFNALSEYSQKKVILSDQERLVIDTPRPVN